MWKAEAGAYVPTSERCEKQTAESRSRGCGLQQWRQVLNVQKVRVDGKWNKDAYAGSHCLWDEVHVEFDVL